jgi:hypothetical protein
LCERDASQAKAALEATQKEADKMKETLDADAEETADKIAVQDAKVERLCGGYYQKQQIIKDAMLMVFQHFSAVLNERLGQEERKDESWIAVSTARFLQIGRKYNRLLKDSHALDTIVQAIEDDLHPDVATIVEQIRALATL